MAFAGTLTIPALIVAALLLGTGEVFFDTNAQALVAALVRPERLVPAERPARRGHDDRQHVRRAAPWWRAPGGLGRPGSLDHDGRVRLGRGPAARHPGHVPAGGRGPRRHLAIEIREGLAFLGRHPLLRTLSTMTALQHAGLAAVFTVIPLYALAPGPVGLTPGGFGLLLSAWGAGAIAGAAVAGVLVDRIGQARLLLVRDGGRGLALLVPAVTAAAPVCSRPLFVGGAGLTAWGTVNASVRQLATPDALRGRVNATHRTMSFTADVAGAAAAGLLAGQGRTRAGHRGWRGRRAARAARVPHGPAGPGGGRPGPRLSPPPTSGRDLRAIENCPGALLFSICTLHSFYAFRARRRRRPRDRRRSRHDPSRTS